MFNFGISNESAVRTSKAQLKPWEIHDVKFIGCEIVEGTSKNDPSKSWKRLDIKFENENGYFNLPLWFPKDGDNKRPEYPASNGGTIVYPSSFELLMATVAQTAQILNPKGFEKMQELSSKFKSFDDVANTLIKVLDPVKGKETKLKLIGKTDKDNRVNAVIPRILAISKTDGSTYIADNYIGDKLFFSQYEENKKKEYAEAKPTKIKSNEDALIQPSEDSEEFNLDDLGLDI